MKTLAVLVCFALVTTPVLAKEQPRWLAVTGGTVIDGTGDEPQPTTTILVENDHIVAIGPGAEVSIPEGATIVDATGKWVIPGLIDAQVHFFQSGGLFARPDIIDLRQIQPFTDEVAEARKMLPKTFARYIASGITGVIDMGGPFWTFDVRTLASGIPRSPRIAVTGPLLTDEAPREFSALDDPPYLEVTSSEEAEKVVARVLGYNPDLIKIWYMAEDGAESSLPPWVDAVIATSHDNDISVVAHVTGVKVAQAMVEAGIDELVHGFDDAEIGVELLAAMKRNDVIYISTLVVDEGYREVFGRHLRLLDLERRLGDPVAIQSLNAFDALPESLVPAWVRPRRPQGLNPLVAKNLVRAHDAGVTIAAGTDAGNIGTLHGPALHRELELMVEAGLSPVQALMAATSGGAHAMGRHEDLGTLEVNKLADMVILDADPVADISNTQNIYRVVKGGVVFDPEEISEELMAETQ